MIPWLEPLKRFALSPDSNYKPLEASISYERLLALIAIAEAAQELPMCILDDYDGGAMEKAVEHAERVE